MRVVVEAVRHGQSIDRPFGSSGCRRRHHAGCRVLDVGSRRVTQHAVSEGDPIGKQIRFLKCVLEAEHTARGCSNITRITSLIAEHEAEQRLPVHDDIAVELHLEAQIVAGLEQLVRIVKPHADDARFRIKHKLKAGIAVGETEAELN